MPKILFYNKFIIRLYMFRALCAHIRRSKLYYTVSGIIALCRWPLRAPEHQKEQSMYIPRIEMGHLTFVSSPVPAHLP